MTILLLVLVLSFGVMALAWKKPWKYPIYEPTRPISPLVSTRVGLPSPERALAERQAWLDLRNEISVYPLVNEMYRPQIPSPERKLM